MTDQPNLPASHCGGGRVFTSPRGSFLSGGQRDNAQKSSHQGGKAEGGGDSASPVDVPQEPSLEQAHYSQPKIGPREPGSDESIVWGGVQV